MYYIYYSTTLTKFKTNILELKNTSGGGSSAGGAHEWGEILSKPGHGVGISAVKIDDPYWEEFDLIWLHGGWWRLPAIFTEKDSSGDEQTSHDQKDEDREGV